MLKTITKGGYLMVRIITGVVAVIFLIYSVFTLWDMFRTEIKAFASYDLLKYRPDIEHDAPPYLDELVKINKDTAGWVTVYGTNIDYPVMKGKDDNEYLNKTATGEYLVSGSIFMSYLNKKDFSDPYVLLYGHHMANGSMFGDIDKFKKDKEFFFNTNNKRFKTDEGVLIREAEVWNLKVFAVVQTDAYDHNIYRADKKQSEVPELLKYIKKHSKYYRDIGDVDKILALSTCDNATSAGRTILMCSMEIRTEPLPTREAEPLTPHRKALGHPMAKAYWAFLNVIILLATIYAAFPVHVWLHEKPKFRKEFILILIIAALSVVTFILTEDMHKPIQIVDVYTPVQLCFLVMIWLIRKYRVRKEASMLAEKDEKNEAENGSSG